MTHTRHYRTKDVSIAYNHLFVVSDDEDKTTYVFRYQCDKLGNNLILSDTSGTILINIRQISLIHLTFDIYDIDENGHQRLLGVLRRKGPPWHHTFIIESIYGEYKIDRMGRLFSHKYAIMQDQQSVAKIKKEDRELHELASIEIEEDADTKKDQFVMALVMILRSV